MLNVTSGLCGVNSTAIVTYIAPEMHGEEILPEGTDNPAEGVQIHGRYYCDICRIGFNERPEFARHHSYTGHVGIHLRRNLKCSSTAIEATPMAAHTYYGKDPRGTRVRLRPRTPSGEQFPSCKEVARFLQSQFLSRPTHQNVAVLPGEDDGDRVNCTAVVPDIAPEMHGEEILLEGTDNSAGAFKSMAGITVIFAE
nr:hypothetical protein Iba_chr06bCG0530 [Ipomoea batatas]